MGRWKKNVVPRKSGTDQAILQPNSNIGDITGKKAYLIKANQIK